MHSRLCPLADFQEKLCSGHVIQVPPQMVLHISVYFFFILRDSLLSFVRINKPLSLKFHF